MCCSVGFVQPWGTISAPHRFHSLGFLVFFLIRSIASSLAPQRVHHCFVVHACPGGIVHLPCHVTCIQAPWAVLAEGWQWWASSSFPRVDWCSCFIWEGHSEVLPFKGSGGSYGFFPLFPVVKEKILQMRRLPCRACWCDLQCPHVSSHLSGAPSTAGCSTGW